MLSVLFMLRRMLRAIKYAVKEENFVVVAGAAIVLILVGTVAYSLGEGWSVVDGFYFAVCTLTTSSIADPNLTLTHDALKIFTAIYVLTGIGILVELARRDRRRVREGARGASRHQTRQAPQGRSARDQTAQRLTIGEAAEMLPNEGLSDMSIRGRARHDAAECCCVVRSRARERL